MPWVQMYRPTPRITRPFGPVAPSARGGRRIRDRRSRAADRGRVGAVHDGGAGRCRQRHAPPGRRAPQSGLLRRAGGRARCGEVVSASHRIARCPVAAGQSARGVGRATGRSTTSRSAAASPRSTPRCESSGAHLPPTTSCVRSTGAMTTDHVRRCASSTVSWVRRIWLNGLFFSLPWYYRSGYDVLLYTLPFHGRRAEKLSPFSGFGYFASGLSGFAESMAQAVHDFRSIVDYLRHTGVERVALTGISLGGYTSALLAIGRRPARGRDPQLPGRHTGKVVRRMVPGQHDWSGWACGSPTSTVTS